MTVLQRFCNKYIFIVWVYYATPVREFPLEGWVVDRFAEYWLTLLAQVGGGRGGAENELVRFGLGALLWGILLAFALKRRREEQIPHETLLAWGFGVGLAREGLMFVVFSLDVSGLIPLVTLHPFFPPLEQALSMAAVCTVAAGFLRGALGSRGGGRRFLALGLGGATVIYLATAVPWARNATAFPGVAFGATWHDWVFHLATAAMLGWALVLVIRLRGWVRLMLLAALGCFFLDEALMLVNLAADDAHLDVLGPVRHVLHLAGIALLTFIYLRQIAGERDEAVSNLQTVINLTEDERRRTEAILDAIGDAVSVQNVAFRILYQNRVHRALMGHHVGDLCYQAYARSASPCPGCPVALAFADGGVHRMERPRALDGGIMEVTASCLRDAAGRIVAGIEVARDVTARVAAARELQLAKEELERQNRELRTLDTMKDGLIRDVTHEFKTPVAKHAMQLEILRAIVREHGLERETERVLGVMAASITRQQKMINNILELARLEAGGRRYFFGPVRLDEVLSEVLEDRAFAIEAHGVTIRPVLQPLVLSSDREILHCLFSNLVENALKYRSPSVAPVIEIALFEEDGQAVVRVTDNGIGFTSDQLERAFERFWQASASAEGSGVGLTICRMIAEDLGGGIAIASAGAGKGTTVTVRLPGDTNVSFAHRPPEERRSGSSPYGLHQHQPPHQPHQHNSPDPQGAASSKSI